MRKIVYFLVILSLATAFTGCTASQASTVSQRPAYFYYSGEDDEEAAAKLEVFLREIGITVVKREKDSVIIKYEGKLILLLPMMHSNISKLDMISAFTFLEVKEKYKGKEILKWKISEMNKKVIGAPKWWLNKDENLVIADGYVTFIDKLEAKEMKAFLNWFMDSVVKKANEKLKKYLK